MRKRLLSLFLALVMVLGMIPVAAFADTSYTIETGDTYAPNNYLGVITQCVVDGAKVLNCKVEDSGTKWTLTLPADTNLEQELTYTLTVSVINYVSRSKSINVSFNGGDYTAVDSKNYTVSFSGVPEWVDGEATVTFATRYQTKTSSDRNRAYTLNLKLDDGVNDPPALAGDAAASVNMRVNETYSVDLATIFADPDNMSLSYQVSVNGGEAAAAEASYSYVPTEAGTYTLVFTASDGESTSQEYTVTLNVRDNAAPVLAGDATLSAEGMHGLAWNIDLSNLFTDADGDALTYTVSVNGGEAEAAAASYSYTPAEAGTHTLVFKAVDVKGAESPAYTVTLEAAANPAPTLAGAAEATVSFRQYGKWSIDLSEVFADNEGDVLTYTVSVDGAAAAATGTAYSYAATAAGAHTFVFQATDMAGNVSPDYTVTLNVQEVVMDPQVIYTGNSVPNPGYYYIATVEMLGANLSYTNGYDVYLDSETPADAGITLKVIAGGSTAGNLGINWNDEPVNTKTYSTNLSGGEQTVKIYGYKAQGAGVSRTGTITLKFHTAAPNNMPTLAEGYSPEAAVVVTSGESLDLNLNEVFTDADGDTLSYTVSIDGGSASSADAAYSYLNAVPGTYVLKFTANDGRTLESNRPTYTVTLTVKNSETTYDVNVTCPEGISPAFYAVKAISGGKMEKDVALAYENGVVKVPSNISVITWESGSTACGTAAVSTGAQLDIKSVSMSAKTVTELADAAATFTVTDPNGVNITLGADAVALLAAGSGYTFKVSPSSTYSGSWNGVTLTEQTVSEDASVEMVYTVKGEKTITVPVEASVQVYLHTQNFAGSKVSPVYTTTNEEDGTVTYHYACTQTQSGLRKYVYRATYPGKITKAGYMNVVNDVTLTWTAEDPSPSYRGSAGIPNYYDADAKSTERRNGDGVYLTLNSTGHLNLPSGSKDIGAYRIWNIIDSDTTNVSIEPDYHFNVVAGDNVVKITDKGSAFGNNWQNLAPNGSGTAFVEVSYDALHIVNGWPEGGWGSALGQMNDYTYNAIDPNATGMIVVQTDGNAASDVTFHIASDRVQFTRPWDAEHDTYYITENTGTLTLAPTATSSIQSVAVSNDKGNIFTELEAVDGAYTATVVPGNNIFRVTNGSGQTAYQVVRVLKLDITLQNKTDESKGAEFAPGDTVRVYMEGLINPCLKMGGIYNPGKVNGSFVGSDGQTYAIQSPSTSWTSGYIFNGNKLYIDVVIPENGQLTLDGKNLFVAGTISLGKHRSLTMGGVGSASATESNGYCSVLPVIVLGEEAASNLPTKTADDVTIESMRLGQWHQVDLTECFTDDLDANLTYYLSRDEGTTWEKITTPKAFLYFPEGVGDRFAHILALDSDHTLEEALADETLQYLTITANVEEPDPVVKVNISVSSGVKDWYLTDRDILMTPQELEVPYFDLALYGLERYYYNPLCYSNYDSSLGNQANKDSQTAGTQESARGIVTSMHALIYATEIYQLGYTPEQAGKGTSHTNGTLEKYLSWNDSAGSSFMRFWPGGSNMNYYIDWKYPLGAPDWGSTSDQQALYGGENICIHSIKDSNAEGSNFVFFTDAEGNPNETTVAWGSEVVLNLQYSYPGEDRVTAFKPYEASVSIISEYDLVHEHDENNVAQVVWQQDASLYASRLEDALETDEEGIVIVDTSYFLPGIYYLGAKGFVDSSSGNEAGPACFKLVITGDQPTATLDKETVSLKVGEEVTLTATVTPSGTEPSFKVNEEFLQVVSTEGNQITVKALKATESTALEIFAGNTSKISESSNLSGNAKNYDVCTFQIQEAEPEAPQVKPGDFDGDNEISIDDVADVISAYRSKRTLSDAEKIAVDFNEDGIVDIEEVAEMISIYRKSL